MSRWRCFLQVANCDWTSLIKWAGTRGVNYSQTIPLCLGRGGVEKSYGCCALAAVSALAYGLHGGVIRVQRFLFF